VLSHVLVPTIASGSDRSGIWVVVLVVLTIGAAAAIASWLSDRGKEDAPPPEVRRQLLFTAVETWVAKGWAVESEREDETLLTSGPSRMLVNVDAHGHVSSHRVADA
jgi:hypothetical protein